MVRLSIIFMVLIGFNSCKKDYFDMNIFELSEEIRKDKSLLIDTSFQRQLMMSIDNSKIQMIKDDRDNIKYGTIVMRDGNIWLAENMRYSIDGTYCYDEENINCENLGLLYRVTHLDEVCPKGWKIPSQIEWHRLVSSYGKATNIAVFFKTDKEEVDEQMAKDKLANGLFNLTLAGSGTKYLNSDRTEFDDIHQEGEYWTASVGNSKSYFISIQHDEIEINKDFFKSVSKRALRYCRCMKSTELSDLLISR